MKKQRQREQEKKVEQVILSKADIVRELAKEPVFAKRELLRKKLTDETNEQIRALDIPYEEKLVHFIKW